MSVATTTLPLETGISDRDISIDLVRCIGIFLVVFGHTWRGLRSSGVLGDEPYVGIVDTAIYLFHMPLFFMLSGYFFERALNHPTEQFISGRVWRLIYPLVIWTWLFGLAKIAGGDNVNDPLAAGGFLLSPFPPQGQFWFLWALFTVQIAAFAFAKVARQTIAWVAFAVMALGSFKLLAEADALHWTYIYALWNIPFFVAGLVLARVPSFLQSPIWIALAVFLAGQLLATTMNPTETFLGEGLALIVTIAAFRLFAGMAESPLPGGVLRPMAAIGALSMPIYLVHTFFAAPARIVLLRLDLTDPILHVVLGTLAGVVGPLVLALVARRLRISAALGF